MHFYTAFPFAKRLGAQGSVPLKNRSLPQLGQSLSLFRCGILLPKIGELAQTAVVAIPQNQMI